jgi:hypothetical protein
MPIFLAEYPEVRRRATMETAVMATTDIRLLAIQMRRGPAKSVAVLAQKK